MATRQTRSMSSSLAAVVTMAIGVGLLGLAVLRWRQNGPGALVWLAALLVMLAIRTPHTLRNRRNVVVDARKDFAETALLAAMFLTMMVLPLLQLATGAFGFAVFSATDSVSFPPPKNPVQNPPLSAFSGAFSFFSASDAEADAGADADALFDSIFSGEAFSGA